MELVQRGAFAKNRYRMSESDGLREIVENRDNKLRSVSRLDNVVGQRTPASPLCSGAAGACRQRRLTGNFIKIFDDIETGKADPADDEKRGNDPAEHAGIIPTFQYVVNS